MNNSAFIDGILKIGADSFFSYDEKDDNRFHCIGGYIFCHAAENLYTKLVRQKEAEPIEVLSKEKKEEYWRLANKFCKEGRDKVATSKAAYILELITLTY